MKLVKTIEILHTEARYIIESGRKAAYHAVNTSMVKTYWEIGQLIVEEEQQGEERAKYGKYLITELSKRLTLEFGKGYDERNLFYMKQFYITYPIVNALRSQLTWTHYRLLTKVHNISARAFYEQEAIKSGWNTRALDRQINAFYYERLSSSLDKTAVENEAIEKVAELGSDVLDFIKNPTVLEFLNLKADHKLYESELEQLLMDNCRNFYWSLGVVFRLWLDKNTFGLMTRISLLIWFFTIISSNVLF
jgi:predicted nuclease of restriction endonuclease-like (RecB) superfamily